MGMHTPGPWKATKGPRGWQIHTDHAGAKHSHWIANIKCESCPAHEDGNANLIAAAPEMLEALNLLNKWFDITGSSIVQRWERIPALDRAAIVAATKAAIAKVEGRA